MNVNHVIKREAWLVFFASLCLFLAFQHGRELIEFESRFGLFTQEMLRRGISLFPSVYGQAYPDYPALYTLLMSFCVRLLGHLDVLAALIPSACAAALTQAITYLTVAMHARRWALAAVLCQLLCYEFIATARSVSLDQLLCLIVVACFYLAYSADVLNKPRRCGGIWILCCLGFALRGPIGLVMPIGVICSYFGSQGRWRKACWIGIVGLLLLAFCLSLLLALAKYYYGAAFAQQVLFMEVLGRVGQAQNHAWTYYLEVLLSAYAVTFPVAMITLWSVGKSIWSKTATPAQQLLRHAVCWALVICLGMSLASEKKIRYILPMVPALSILAAYPFYQMRACANLYKALLRACQCLPWVALLLIVILLTLSPWHILVQQAYLISTTLVLLVVVLINLVIKYKAWDEFGLLVGAVVAWLSLNIGIAEPLQQYANRAQPFVAMVEHLRQPQQRLVFYRIGPDAEDVKFMVAWNQAYQPTFLHNHESLQAYHKPALFIARDEDFNRIPSDLQQHLRVLWQGRLGHQWCVVFVKQANR